MLATLAVSHYRSLLDLVIPLGRLNVITGANGSGKSNLYRALHLLAETQRGGAVRALAREGGMGLALWAGPEEISRRMRQGSVPVQGSRRRGEVRLRLGFGGDDFGYALTLGYPEPSSSAFALDPEIKHEAIWAGPVWRRGSALIERSGSILKARAGRGWDVIAPHIDPFESLFDRLGDPSAAPEVFTVREKIRGWRFYHHFRTDAESPVRAPQLATRTPVLHHDGRDLAAALQTVREIGDAEELEESIEDAFPGSRLNIRPEGEGRLAVELSQRGLLRPLGAQELSDGTLRYLLLMAALMTPRPPSLLVLNEPESSLHPELLRPLAQRIVEAARRTQVWVISHSDDLVAALEDSGIAHSIRLQKSLGATEMAGLGSLERPSWHWPS